MSLELCILASGSLGNAALLRCPSGVLLIDLGIGPRITAKRLDGTGVRLADIRACCLTHLDSDHFNPNWIATLIRNQITIHCDQEKSRRLLRDIGPDFKKEVQPLVSSFNGSTFHPLPGLSFSPIPLVHDQTGSHGFVIEGFGYRIGYATDLGHVPAHLPERFKNLNLLALESNYDTDMQEQSARPWFLKRRIMGGKGHLSNHQALQAIKQILDRADRLPDHIVLLHRSRECNCPKLVRTLFSKDKRIAPRLTLAEQFHRSDWLRPRTQAPATGEQLLLQF